jgi:hypothetical protein
MTRKRIQSDIVERSGKGSDFTRLWMERLSEPITTLQGGAEESEGE